MLRAIVLAAAKGLTNGAIARHLGVGEDGSQVAWAFAARGMERLLDDHQSGRPKSYGPEVRVAIIASAASATASGRVPLSRPHRPPGSGLGVRKLPVEGHQIPLPGGRSGQCVGGLG